MGHFAILPFQHRGHVIYIYNLIIYMQLIIIILLYDYFDNNNN